MRMSRIVECLRFPRIRGNLHCSLLLRSRETYRSLILEVHFQELEV